MKELKAITDQKNISSQALLKKLGFKYTGKTVLPNENDELLLLLPALSLLPELLLLLLVSQSSGFK